MRFVLSLDMGNAAFTDAPAIELARAQAQLQRATFTVGSYAWEPTPDAPSTAESVAAGMLCGVVFTCLALAACGVGQ